MTERQGVEIDYCPQCRGVWLDRGELDKIIEKSNNENEGSASRQTYQEPSKPRQGYYDDHRQQDEYYHKKKHKREGFLGDLFDF